MLFHEQECLLYMVMIDHLTGEQLGYEVSRFYELGASNVQLIPAVTKKNRPSHILLINCRRQYGEQIEAAIPVELGVGGWHVFRTEHHYIANRIVTRRVTVRDAMSGETFPFEVKGKEFEGCGLRPEHDGVVQLQQEIHEHFHLFIPYGELYHRIATVLLEQDRTEILLPKREAQGEK